MERMHLVSALLIAAAVVCIALVYAYGGTQLADAQKYCEKNEDCACGVHKATGDCFYGNKAYVNTEQQCPDFCSGIAAHLEIVCKDRQCAQVRK